MKINPQRNWIESYHGNQIIIGHVAPSQISIDEIAWVLSGIRRFGNHAVLPYNVADHSVRVWQIIKNNNGKRCDWQLELAALLHDGSEAYSGFGDVCKPAKNLAPIISKIEHQIEYAIEKRFKLPLGLLCHPQIKHADRVMLATEKRDIMRGSVEPWLLLPDPLPKKLKPRSERSSRLAFIAAYEKIMQRGRVGVQAA